MFRALSTTLDYSCHPQTDKPNTYCRLWQPSLVSCPLVPHPLLCFFQAKSGGQTLTRRRMSAVRWFALGRTPMHATSSTRWRATSYAWTEASLTHGTTSKSLQACGKRAGDSLLCSAAFPHPGSVCCQRRKDPEVSLLASGRGSRLLASRGVRRRKLHGPCTWPNL